MYKWTFYQVSLSVSVSCRYCLRCMCAKNEQGRIAKLISDVVVYTSNLQLPGGYVSFIDVHNLLTTHFVLQHLYRSFVLHILPFVNV